METSKDESKAKIESSKTTDTSKKSNSVEPPKKKAKVSPSKTKQSSIMSFFKKKQFLNKIFIYYEKFLFCK